MPFELVKHLNWAQVASAVCGVGVVVFTLISSNIQQKQSEQKDKANQEVNNRLIELQKQNIELSKESKAAVIEHVDNISTPDIRITNAAVKSKQFEVTIKNFGHRTAESVCLTWGYKYATEIKTSIQELPPDMEFTFTCEVFPFDSNPSMGLNYSEIKQLFAEGKRALVVDLEITFRSNTSILDPLKYSLIYSGRDLLLTRI